MKSITWKQFGVIIIIILGLILAFSPVIPNKGSLNKIKNIAEKIKNHEDHITAEELGHMIIDGDPDYILIDIRSAQEFEKFHIKTAVNIPLDQLFTSEILSSLSTDKLVILYSNGNEHSAQAWVLLREFGFDNTEILLGGLNYWVDVYSNPTPPKGHYADSEIFRYEFLVSAGPGLLGNNQSIQTKAESVTPLKVIPKKRIKKKKAADEGC